VGSSPICRSGSCTWCSCLFYAWPDHVSSGVFSGNHKIQNANNKPQI